MSQPEIIVVGGGIIGVTTAYEFARRGLKTTLLEANENVGLETTHANGGLLTASMSDPWNAPGVHRALLASVLHPHAAIKLRLAALPSLAGWGLQFLKHSSPASYMHATRASFVLAKYSVERTRELRKTLSLQYDATTRGTLKIFRDHAAMKGPAALAENLRDLGLKVQALDARGAAAVEPALDPIRCSLAGALLFPDDESGDAFVFCQALRTAFERTGGITRIKQPVLGLLTQGERIKGIRTRSGELKADCVVMAAGNATGLLVRELRIPVAVRPAKGYTLTFDVSGLRDCPAIPVIDDAMHAAITPLGARLRVAGTAEFAGTDRTLRRERIENLLNLLSGLYPRVRAQLDPQSGRAWTGFRPMSADGLPFIGPTRITGLYLNTGHGHLGWTLANGSASLLADLVSGERPAIDPAPYHAMRAVG